MRKILTFLAVIMLAFYATAAKKAPLVTSIDPPYWWTGMANDTLQLFIYGNNVKDAVMTVDYPGVKITDIADLDGSTDYKVVYLTLGKETAPGTMSLSFTLGKQKQTVGYELKKRTWKPTDNPGFDASDVLYLIMPDRFSDGDTTNNDLPASMRPTPPAPSSAQANNPGRRNFRMSSGADRSRPGARHGGDIKGLRNHLDYIDDLGVTAIWVNPVLTNNQPGGSYHGYATTDYYSIDPRFGSNDEWRDFVKAAHDRGLKVVMDMIFNHCGSSHVWMQKFPSSDWFNHQAEFEKEQTVVGSNHKLYSLFDPYASDIDRDLTVNGWFNRGMPDLNQLNPHLLTYLIQNSIFWIEDSQIDGIRMDTYPYADMRGMARWIDAVDHEYPYFNIVGECWYESDASNAFWQRGSKVNSIDPRLKTVMDFKFILGGKDYFGEETVDKGTGLHSVYEHLSTDYLYPDPQHILTFLDNHDTDRFLKEAPENLDSWKQALTFLLTSRGIPQIYYGTEILMHGTRDKGGDPAIRLDMPGGFPGDTTTVFTREGRTPMQNEAFDYLSSLLKWRRSQPANDVIARGALKHFAPRNGIYVYTRTLGDHQVLVLMNGTGHSAIVDADHYAEILPDGRTFHNILDNTPYPIEGNIELAPRATIVLANF